MSSFVFNPVIDLKHLHMNYLLTQYLRQTRIDSNNSLTAAVRAILRRKLSYKLPPRFKFVTALYLAKFKCSSEHFSAKLFNSTLMQNRSVYGKFTVARNVKFSSYRSELKFAPFRRFLGAIFYRKILASSSMHAVIGHSAHATGKLVIPSCVEDTLFSENRETS